MNCAWRVDGGHIGETAAAVKLKPWGRREVYSGISSDEWALRGSSPRVGMGVVGCAVP
jgi:hypothetical protein